SKLTSDGGLESMCGWLKDKFGVSWQITPSDMKDLVQKPDVMHEMMKMKKLDIAKLRAAAK
ncbi:MAG: VOC family protein, partial [Bacteroidota bacterium]|nr:VOC family protein [Bacteroidota bacterium]